MPKRRFSATSRPATLPSSPITFNRNASPCPSEGSGRSTSKVTSAREIRSDVQAAGNELGQPGRLAGLIDHAACRTAAKHNRSRALQHFDLLGIKRIAIVAAEIAHAVDEQIVARRESADCQIVALRSAFARRQADAGHISQGIAQRRDALLLHHGVWNGSYGLRGVERILRELWRRRGQCLHAGRNLNGTCDAL